VRLPNALVGQLKLADDCVDEKVESDEAMVVSEELELSIDEYGLVVDDPVELSTKYPAPAATMMTITTTIATLVAIAFLGAVKKIQRIGYTPQYNLIVNYGY
jgi:hypothetical protein